MENIHTKQKKKKGFTLIELIIVMAILGILALIAIPKFGAARKDAKVNSDFATAKTIANTTSTLLASDKIKQGEELTITLDSSDTTNKKYVDAIKERLNDGIKDAQACNKPFIVKISKEGDVKVQVINSKTYELYPKQDKGYPDGTPETTQPTP